MGFKRKRSRWHLITICKTCAPPVKYHGCNACRKASGCFRGVAVTEHGARMPKRCSDYCTITNISDCNADRDIRTDKCGR
jgi:hypothetical protein